jgi:hypothetical protein
MKPRHSNGISNQPNNKEMLLVNILLLFVMNMVMELGRVSQGPWSGIGRPLRKEMSCLKGK